MKEFVSAYEDVVAEDEREAKIKALVESGKTQAEAEAEVEDDDYIEFKIDDRVMRAYTPTEGQLAFMLAALGRGQTQDSRFAAILNIMFESLRGDDKDYLENRLLSRDPKKRLSMKMIESIFEHITSEWFARPTQSPSDSV
jgi:hypothetical protein